MKTIMLALLSTMLLSACASVSYIKQTQSLETEQHKIRTVYTKGAFYSTPLITKAGTVVITNHRRKVYFFDTLGYKIQQYTTQGWVHATPSLVNDSLVVFGAYDKHLYFLTMLVIS